MTIARTAWRRSWDLPGERANSQRAGGELAPSSCTVIAVPGCTVRGISRESAAKSSHNELKRRGAGMKAGEAS